MSPDVSFNVRSTPDPDAMSVFRDQQFPAPPRLSTIDLLNIAELYRADPKRILELATLEGERHDRDCRSA